MTRRRAPLRRRAEDWIRRPAGCASGATMERLVRVGRSCSAAVEAWRPRRAASRIRPGLSAGRPCRCGLSLQRVGDRPDQPAGTGRRVRRRARRSRRPDATSCRTLPHGDVEAGRSRRRRQGCYSGDSRTLRAIPRKDPTGNTRAIDHRRRSSASSGPAVSQPTASSARTRFRALSAALKTG